MLGYVMDEENVAFVVVVAHKLVVCKWREGC